MNVRRLNYGLCAVLLLCAAQITVMMLSLRAYMAHDSSTLWPAAIASVVLLLVNILLLLHVHFHRR